MTESSLFHLNCKISYCHQIVRKHIRKTVINNPIIHYTAARRNLKLYTVRMKEEQKEGPHLDISWLDIDEEEVPNNNASREPKAKSSETKNSADYTHLGFLPEPSDQMPALNQKLQNKHQEDIINRNLHS